MWNKPPFKTFRDEVLMALGAGYYSYGKKKASFYSDARARLGALLGLIYADNHLLGENTATIEAVEEKLIPAISSLIKKMEIGIKS